LFRIDCDGVPANPGNWKHGGSITYGNFTWHVEPVFDRGYQPGQCSFNFTGIYGWPDDKGYGWELKELIFKDNGGVTRFQGQDILVKKNDKAGDLPVMTITYLSKGKLTVTLGNTDLVFAYGDNIFDQGNQYHAICTQVSCVTDFFQDRKGKHRSS
jgi:hypothetical protein